MKRKISVCETKGGYGVVRGWVPGKTRATIGKIPAPPAPPAPPSISADGGKQLEPTPPAGSSGSGKHHRMRMAKLSPRMAKKLGLNSNHHARVWCECMDDPLHPTGWAPSGLYWNPERTIESILSDPRRLWSYDALGVIDLRVPNSGLAMYREHLRKSES